MAAKFMPPNFSACLGLAALTGANVYKSKCLMKQFELISTYGAGYITPTDRRALSWMLKNGSENAFTARKEFELRRSDDWPGVLSELEKRAKDTRLLNYEREAAKKMIRRGSDAFAAGRRFYVFFAMDHTFRARYFLFA